MNIEKGDMILVDQETNQPVEQGATVKSFRNEEYILTGGKPPHKPSSQGFVYVSPADMPQGNNEFYPNVFGLKWIKKS